MSVLDDALLGFARVFGWTLRATSTAARRGGVFGAVDAGANSFLARIFSMLAPANIPGTAINTTPEGFTRQEARPPPKPGGGRSLLGRPDAKRGEC
jgi:hypothetical protein